MKHTLKKEITDFIKASRFNEAKTYLVTDLTIKVQEYYKSIHSIHKEDINLNFAHYTNIRTVHSILKNYHPDNPTYLRLYDTSSLNDPNEGSYLKSELIEKGHMWLKHAELDTDAYVCSFVRGKEDIGNAITYWQSYGKNGLGCSIQLSPRYEHREILTPTLYGEDGIQDLIDKFKDYFDLGSTIYQNLLNGNKQKFATNFWKAFDSVKFIHKHIGYKYENECRLIETHQSGEIYDDFKDDVPHFLKRYVVNEKLEAKKIFTSGTKVFIGPRIEGSQRLCQYLKKLADQAGLDGTEFIPSKIPYR